MGLTYLIILFTLSMAVVTSVSYGKEKGKCIEGQACNYDTWKWQKDEPQQQFPLEDPGKIAVKKGEEKVKVSDHTDVVVTGDYKKGGAVGGAGANFHFDTPHGLKIYTGVGFGLADVSPEKISKTDEVLKQRVTVVYPWGDNRQIYLQGQSAQYLDSDQKKFISNGTLGFESIALDDTKITASVTGTRTHFIGKADLLRHDLAVMLSATRIFGASDYELVDEARKMISWAAVKNTTDKSDLKGYFDRDIVAAQIESLLRFSQDVEQKKIPQDSLAEMMISNSDGHGKYLGAMFDPNKVSECGSEISRAALLKASELLKVLNNRYPTVQSAKKIAEYLPKVMELVDRSPAAVKCVMKESNAPNAQAAKAQAAKAQAKGAAR